MGKQDLFFEAYDREDVAYGLQPSAELAAYLAQVKPRGEAIDLGAGAGRDTLALAKAGLTVRAVDLSDRGLDRVVERARRMRLLDRVTTIVGDARRVDLPERTFSVIVATTVLCHLTEEDGLELWKRISAAINDSGMIYAEVHTTEDPGSDESPGRENRNPVSETASAVVHYFRPGELLRWAMHSRTLRVLRYEERLEWDYTHGKPHQHGKAILVAVRDGFFPPWYGHPVAFAKRPDDTEPQ
jgi:cyclopropane fatty-acyl-phospholipid synthase-like methyltransferase